MKDIELNQNQGLDYTVLNAVTMITFAVALVVLFTNLIPLEQMGVLGVNVTKKLAVRWTRLAVLGHFGILAFIYFFRRNSFDRLWVVRGMKALANMKWTSLSFSFFFIYAMVMIAVGFTRHWALETRAFDLGIFAQAVWNTLQGDFLYSSLKGGINLMGDHVSPILAFISPLYAVWPDPRNLLILQAVAAGACLFPLGYIAKEKLGDRWLIFVILLAYAFYLPTRNALHEDFHPEVLAEPFLLLAFIFLERKRIIPFIFALLVAVSTKENMMGVAFMLGFYAFWVKRMRVFGALVMSGSAALFFFCVMWVVPHFSSELYLYRGSYSHILSNPVGGLAQAFLNPDSLEYFFKIFLPFIFLPFFHLPTLILTFPVLFQNMLSRNPVMRSFGYHYTTGLTPFVFIAAIYGFKYMTDRFQWLNKQRLVLGTLLLMVALLRSGPSEYYFWYQSFSHGSEQRVEKTQLLRQIPQEASVLTHNNLIPQIVNRKYVYQFGYSATPSKKEMADELKPDYVILDEEFWEREARPLAEELPSLTGSGYGTVAQKNGFYILKRLGDGSQAGMR